MGERIRAHPNVRSVRIVKERKNRILVQCSPGLKSKSVQSLITLTTLTNEEISLVLRFPHRLPLVAIMDPSSFVPI
jgi:hypothetical protein